jgi:hypothetical protein
MVRFVDKDNKTEFANKIGPWESDGNSAGKSNILKNNERVGVIDDEVEYMTINAFSSGSASCENVMPGPPPVPTFNQELSAIDKRVTIKFTDIMNAHESYTLQIEREDGTVLKTKKLNVGDTSITLSYQESSYATYKYVIKLIYEDDIISTSINSLEVKPPQYTPPSQSSGGRGGGYGGRGGGYGGRGGRGGGYGGSPPPPPPPPPPSQPPSWVRGGR